MQHWMTDLCRQISMATDRSFVPSNSAACSGGCIHHTEWLTGKCGRSFFVKTSNRSNGVALFAAEAAGLNAIFNSNTIRVPALICTGQAGDGTAFLVLEAIRIQDRGRSDLMGRKLAAMHQVVGESFGWEHSNFIGASTQNNTLNHSWIDFYREQRLRFQLELAERNGLMIPEAEHLLDSLERFFHDYTPRPSLVHGDLWGGNAGFTPAGEPLIFDPAAYYGDRETDLAFTYMFGGFNQQFYQGYEAIWPLDVGFAQRKPLYNLYHELNHYNLFGGGYGVQAHRTIRQLLDSGCD